jgi:hypothetical protein
LDEFTHVLTRLQSTKQSINQSINQSIHQKSVARGGKMDEDLAHESFQYLNHTRVVLDGVVSHPKLKIQKKKPNGRT